MHDTRKPIIIDNSTIVTGTTSTNTFLLVDINDKKSAIPLYTFSASYPNIDIVDLIDVDVSLSDVTVVNSATSYGVGVALYVNSSAVSFPLYKVDSDANVALDFHDGVIVDSMESTGTFVAIKIDSQSYGIPIHNFNSVFPTTTVTASSYDITTTMGEPAQDTNTDVQASTYANSKISTYSEVITRMKRNLGYPFVEIELCDEQFLEYIDQACEFYTQYGGWTEEFLAFDSSKYPAGRGIHIPDVLEQITTYQQSIPDDEVNFVKNEFLDPATGQYRKCVNVYSLDEADRSGLDSLFTLEYIYATQAYYTATLGSIGFDLVTWETLKHFLDARKRSFAQTPRYRFDVYSQRLRITPEPNRRSHYIGILGLYLERPVADIIKQRWVQHYALAIAKIAIGQIRTKFGSVTLFGGGQINGTDLLSQGLEEKQRLEDEILKTNMENPPLFFIG